MAFAPGEPTQTLTIENVSKGGTAKNTTMDIEVTTSGEAWLAVEPAAVTLSRRDDAAAITVTVTGLKADFSEATITVVGSVDGDEKVSETVTVTTGDPKFFTQMYDPALEGQMVQFTPATTPSYYQADIIEIPEAAANVNMRASVAGLTPVDWMGSSEPLPYVVGYYNEANEFVDMDVAVYGEAADTILLGSDGRVTLADTDAVIVGDDLVDAHFAVPGISGLLVPLALDGSVYVIPFEDRMTVVYDGVPQADDQGAAVAGSANSFQIELFFADAAKAVMPETLALSWFDVDDGIEAVVGLSSGEAPAELVESDLVNQAGAAANTLPLTVAMEM
jgi:hypothetical protein